MKIATCIIAFCLAGCAGVSTEEVQRKASEAKEQLAYHRPKLSKEDAKRFAEKYGDDHLVRACYWDGFKTGLESVMP